MDWNKKLGTWWVAYLAKKVALNCPRQPCKCNSSIQPTKQPHPYGTSLPIWTAHKPATSTTWNKCSAGLTASFTQIIQIEPKDVPPTWSRVLGGSLYSIDGTQTDSLCYSESSMVWLTSLPTTFNPTTPVWEVPNACGSYKQLKTSTSSLFTRVLSVTGIDCLPLLPMSSLCRNLGTASLVLVLVLVE